jgi:hypothetical protein
MKSIVYYTDGFRKDGPTDIGIYSPSVRQFEALDFQAEMYATNLDGRMCLEHKGNDNKHTFIM